MLSKINAITAEQSETNEEIEFSTSGELLESPLPPQNEEINLDQASESGDTVLAASENLSPQEPRARRNLQQNTTKDYFGTMPNFMRATMPPVIPPILPTNFIPTQMPQIVAGTPMNYMTSNAIFPRTRNGAKIRTSDPVQETRGVNTLQTKPITHPPIQMQGYQ